MIIKTAAADYSIDYDWPFLNDGKAIAGVWRDNSGLGASVDQMRSGSPAPTPPVPPTSGTAITGTWNWVSGQTPRINADGAVQLYQGSSKINQRRWVNPGGRQYRLSHRSGGWVDTVTLPADGMSLDGVNNAGSRAQGSRR